MFAANNKYDLIIKGGEIVNQSGRHRADLGVTDGKISAIGMMDDQFADSYMDAGGLTILPGVIDTQVHFREPGETHKDDMESGSRSAVLGGVTSIFELPDTVPATLTAEGVKDKLIRAKGRMWCDHAFYIGATADNARALGWLEKLPGVCGVHMSMGGAKNPVTGAPGVSSDEDLYHVLRHGNRRVSVHAQDAPSLAARKGRRISGDLASDLDWQTSQSLLHATERALHQARRAGRRIHIMNVSTAEQMMALVQHKDIATADILPQNLSFAAPDIYADIGSRAQQDPPIRDAAHRDILWHGLQTGVVDTLASKHAPHMLEEKARPYPDSLYGMPGVQTLVPVMLTYVAEGRLSLERFVDLTSHGPQRVFNLRDKGRIALGYDADFTIVDRNSQWEITDSHIASRCGWTPFAGFKATGKAVATIVRGQTVMRDGELQGAPSGGPIRFQETLNARLEPQMD